jgi:hypothetical protein
MDQSPQTMRRSNRSKVMLKATLEVPNESLEVVLRDLSQDGALVRANRLPEEGAPVLFHRQGLCVPGKVAWLHKDFAGIAFYEPLFPREMLRHVPPAEAKAPRASIRRPGFSGKPLTADEQQMVEELAAEPALGA